MESGKLSVQVLYVYVVEWEIGYNFTATFYAQYVQGKNFYVSYVAHTYVRMGEIYVLYIRKVLLGFWFREIKCSAYDYFLSKAKIQNSHAQFKIYIWKDPLDDF